jgi:hypothetical protein
MSVLRELSREAHNEGLTEFMTEILRVDDGRRKRIKRVDVLCELRQYTSSHEQPASLQPSHAPMDATVNINES